MATPGLNAGGPLLVGNHSYFIEGKRLGVLEQQLRELLNFDMPKRLRVREANRLSSILHALRLVPRTEIIIGLSLGVRIDGEVGLFVFIDSSTKIQGNLPEELG